MSRPSQVVVLGEDERHVRFVRGHLRKLGLGPHAIRIRELPAGRGCGEQWVRERYAQEVLEYRRRSARAKTAFIVAIDADNGDLRRRLSQLEQGLVEAQLANRSDDERIALLIPRWSIETWVLVLNGKSVSEDEDHRHDRGIDEMLLAAASTFWDWSRPNATAPGHCVPSLQSALVEVRRIEQ